MAVLNHLDKIKCLYFIYRYIVDHRLDMHFTKNLREIIELYQFIVWNVVSIKRLEI